MLQAGDEPGLRLEPVDELGRIGEIGADDLDRHPPLRARLGGRVDTTVGPLADGVVDRVPAQRPTERRPVRRVTVGDRRLQPSQVRGRVQAGLAGQAAAEPTPDPHRLGLTPRRLEGLHQQPHRTLVQRTFEGHPLQVGNRPVVMAHRHLRLRPGHLGRDPPLGKP